VSSVIIFCLDSEMTLEICLSERTWSLMKSIVDVCILRVVVGRK
jgi:hypothetical protein